MVGTDKHDTQPKDKRGERKSKKRNKERSQKQWGESGETKKEKVVTKELGSSLSVQQLVSTQPANKEKRNFMLFFQLRAVLIILLVTYKQQQVKRRSSWSLAELKLNELNREN